MVERTEHGEERHEDESRPTSEALQDKADTNEIYLDIETGYYVFVGMRGRTHIFTIENLHHTSFRTTKYNRFERQISGKWEIVFRKDLPDTLK